MNKLQRNQQGFGLVEGLLIILILAVIGFGGYYVWHSQHKTVVVSATTTTTSTTPSTPKAADPTAGWNSFTSKLGGFSFKYPASGWTLTAYDNSSGSWVTSPAITGNESVFAVNENAGQGSSTNTLQYSINFDIDNQHNVGTNNGPITYNLGSVVRSFSNGLSIWQTSEDTFNNSSSSPKCGDDSIVELIVASNGDLEAALPNGQYLGYDAGFCEGPGQTLTQTYQQQVNAPEATVAKEVLSTISL